MKPVKEAATIALLVLGLAACGGSSKQSSTKAHISPTQTSSSAGEGVATGRMRATLTAPNHSPTAGKNWPYTVHVTDPDGHPLSGTVRIQFALGGQVVGTDTPPVHPLKNGRWHDNLQFPRRSAGLPLTFQVVVHTRAGSVTLNWSVSVKP